MLVVIGLVAAAIGTARLASPLFESLRLRLHGPPEPRFTRRAVRLLSAALASFALLVAAHVRPWSDLPLLLIALAMGVSIAAMLYRAERMLNIARPVSVIFAAAAFVATEIGRAHV